MERVLLNKLSKFYSVGMQACLWLYSHTKKSFGVPAITESGKELMQTACYPARSTAYEVIINCWSSKYNVTGNDLSTLYLQHS